MTLGESNLFEHLGRIFSRMNEMVHRPSLRVVNSTSRVLVLYRVLGSK